MLSTLSKKSRAVFADPQDEIVISGMAGKFPNSYNVAHFASNLFNKVDMVDDEERRWLHTNPEIPKRIGKMYNLEKFDASFFGIHERQAQALDPQCRFLLEQSYEAVLDSGYNPKSLRGSRTGVFIGCCYGETEKVWIYDRSPKDGVGLSGNSRALLANRISFCLGLQGPSFMIDTACSSSMYALDAAYNAMQNGECDAAIVGGTNLLLHPNVSLQFAKLGVLAADGFCRPFDQDAAGYTRAEAIGLLFLQRRKDAKRVYSNLVYSKTNCDGFKNEGLHYPSGTVQMKLLKEFYEDIRMSPTEVDYVEAHSTGTVAGDPEECRAIDEIFCTGRNKPLNVGSVKSNMGHAEASSGVSSIVKAILIQENQKIPPNINFNSPKKEIPALAEGRLKVVSEVTDFDGSLICVNSFGFGGANAHALFKSNSKLKINRGIPNDDIPRLVVWSGRTEQAVESIIESVTKQPLDAEFVALLQHSQLDSVPANLYRGYGVFTQNGNEDNANCALRGVEYFSGKKLPVVWVYSGMGSQWSGMGRDLMKIPIFANSIENCHKILAPRGFDLKEIITSSDATMFDNILHSFVGIAAVQIGLTDILKALGLAPDHIIGHSVGELGCAYADGCFTAEEMILSAYSRGMASIEAKVPRGSMAAVGLGFNKLKKMLPEGVEIACHNSGDSCTISGLADNIAAFVEDLKSKNIFAKEVACSNIPYHSTFISQMGPKLLSKLQKVVKSPKKRSSKWISSSFAQTRWNEENCQISGAEYHTNNLLSPVLFDEASKLLPKESIMIEIAPHGLLQAILKRSFQESKNIPLTQRAHRSNEQFFLAAIGKIHSNGCNLDIPAIFPKVEFPVSRGTPMIAPNVKWDHSLDWFVTSYRSISFDKSAERKIKVSLTDPDFDFMSGHTIDGRCIFPATGYLYYVWESLARVKGLFYFDIGVEFEDVKFVRAATLTKENEIELVIVINPGNGRFEISEGGSTLVTGVVREATNVCLTDIQRETSESGLLSNKDFYKELRLRGYHYNGLFRSVTEASSDGLYGKIKWQMNWIAFLDCLLQIQIVGQDSRSLNLPTSIQKMIIDTPTQLKIIKEFGFDSEPDLEVFLSPELKTLRSGGIEIVNLQANVVGRRRPPGIPVLESYKFIPYTVTESYDTSTCARIIVQLALENVVLAKVKAVEIDGIVRKSILKDIRDALEDLPLVTPELTLISSRALEDETDITIENTKLSTHNKCYFLISSSCVNNCDLFEKARSSFADNGFMICRENLDIELKNVIFPEGYTLVSLIRTSEELYVVLQFRKTKKEQAAQAIVITEKDSSFEWIERVKEAMKNGPLVLVAENEPTSGLIGLVNCLRKEPNESSISCVFIDDVNAPKFDIENPFYQNQIGLGLAINVLKDGSWGSYRHLQIQKINDQRSSVSHCFVNALVKSDLSSLKWISGPFNYSRPAGELVKVQYAALNFRDVMLASGKLSADVFAENRMEHECVLGIEYSGVTASGRRVMGMTSSAALATHVASDGVFNFTCPDQWTLAEAATVPCVYGTVYAAFFMSARIEKGKSILIHAGSGGVGLAAIRVAFAYGLDVYTTVSTEEKKIFLLNEFPQLKRENIGNSRDLSFEKMIQMRTKGKGVHYVLNSLAEEKLIASIRCLGKGGKFLEIGKFDMANNTKIGLGSFLNELSFHAIMVDKLFKAPEKEKLALKVLLERDLKAGIIKPLKTNIFEAHEVEQAFRLLASGKHMGKVILKIRENESDPATLPISVIPRIYCSPSLSYIIPGGLGGFGLELADWLVLRGCRKLVLSSSRGITKQYQAYRIKIWESYGVHVRVNTSDISTKAGCEQLIRDSMKLGPVGGIFNLAVVLKDGIFDNQDVENFITSMAPKAVATKHLDELSRVLCPELQYFVVFSSVSCGRGNAGQSNYGMANSVMERIIEQRHLLGLPAKAIQWGAIGEVGLVADMMEDKLDLEIGGTLQQRISSCLEEMDSLMTVNDPLVSSMVVAEKRYSSSKGGNILDTAMSIMGIRNLKSISLETTLTELGMDSLMAVELKQIFERDYEIFLSTQELRALNFSKIIEFAKSKESTEATAILKNPVANVVEGLESMITHLGDETYSDVTILPLGVDKSADKCRALMIPGIEGMAGELWYKVANALNFPTGLLQFRKTLKAETFDEVIKIIENDILEYFSDTNHFQLIAHCYGTIFALRIAALLESKGKTGHITFVDGSPTFLKLMSEDQFLESTSEDYLRQLLISHVLSNILSELPDSLKKEIFLQPSWDEQVAALIKHTDMKHKYSDEYLQFILNFLVSRARLLATTTSDIDDVMKASTILVRPATFSLMDVSEDYNLSKNFEKKMKIVFLEGNHTSILENEKFVELMNETHAEIQR